MSNYTYHLSKKIPCTNATDCSKMQQNAAQHKPIESNIEHKCNYCNKEFTRRSSLNVHINERCKVKKNNDNEKEEIFKRLIEEMQAIKAQNEKLKEENKSLKLNTIESAKTINNNIDKQQNITIDKQQNINHNNIKLVAFGKEDLGYISDTVYKKLLNKGFKSVQYMLEHVHFNKAKPEHQNIYIPNLKNDYVTIFNGDDWTLKKKDDIMDTIIDNTNGYLAEKFDEFIKDNSLDEATIRKYQRYLDEQDDASVKKTIKEEIKLILYNNRKLPMNIRKMFETSQPKLIEQ
jgi:hypothetical protein